MRELNPHPTVRADGLGFTAGAPLRLLAAAGFAVAAFGAVALATGAPPPPPPPAIAAPPATVADSMLDLTITATYPVASWSVQGPDGALTARASDATRWQGAVRCASAGPVHLFVQADHQDALSAAPVALRVAWPGGAALLWGEGFVAEAVSVGGR
jgi:hypothetical protein